MDDLSQIFADMPVPEPAAPAARTPRPVAREWVYHAVRRAIVEGRIAPGTRLTERGLCEAFGISRPIVREVIRMLAAEKLGDFEPHVGLRVAELSRARVREIYQLRAEIEAIVVRGFLAAATDADIATARDYGARVVAAVGRGDRTGAVETMAEFERFMASVADNQVAAEVLAHLNARVNMLRLMAMRAPGQAEVGMQGVRAVAAAIDARDPDAAVSAVRTFVRLSGEAVLRHMDNPDGPSDPNNPAIAAADAPPRTLSNPSHEGTAP